MIVAEAVVFPSITAQSEAAAAAHKAAGVDVSAFLDIAKDPEALSYYPITFKADEINTEADLVIEKIKRGEADPASALAELAAKVNALLSE